MWPHAYRIIIKKNVLIKYYEFFHAVSIASRNIVCWKKIKYTHLISTVLKKIAKHDTYRSAVCQRPFVTPIRITQSSPFCYTSFGFFRNVCFSYIININSNNKCSSKKNYPKIKDLIILYYPLKKTFLTCQQSWDKSRFHQFNKTFIFVWALFIKTRLERK